MCEPEYWIKILSALLTPTIALIAVYVAWQQWRTAERKRRQDLFDRRYEFFSGMWGMFSDPIVNPEARPLDVEDLLDYTHEAELLFGKDIVKHIFEIPDRQKKGSLDYDWFIKPFKKYMQLH